MRYLNHTFCVSVAALFMSVTSSSALPPCPNTPILVWDACFGTFTYPSQSSYEGEWALGKYSGYGSYTFANGNKYVGEFKKSLPNGQGNYDFANGNQYIGGFLDGKRHGQGSYIYANGNKYCLLYTSPSPRDSDSSRMPSSA